ncbi:MAG TPA: ShlB/FhaC/HecB family hemolysin secretion/activation protein [Rhizomicrobium sp.]|nr:ShlB/FhaC/HecB family hemolysin secretion/activation protein [Rhizomicrobium sp.]
MTARKISPASGLRRFHVALLCFAAYGVLVSADVASAAPVIPGAAQPGRDRPLPEPPKAPEDYNFSIEAPHRSSVPRAVDEIHFELKDVKIVGSVTIPADRFRPLYADLIGKDVTLTNIYDVADGIERIYREAGYPLVRAYVPPQRVKDGIFTIKVVEGFVSTVSVEGVDGKTQDRIRSYLGDVSLERPLRLSSIERGLLLSNDLPGVSATGILRPAPDTPGASDLVISAAQPKFTGGLAADNRGSRFSGIWTITGDAEINSVFFGGDQIMGDVTLSPNSLEQIGGDLRYRTPIGSDGMMGSLIGRYTHGEPGSTLSAANVLTNSYAIGPRLSYPFIRSRAETLTLDGGFTVQDARVNVLGFGISHDKWRVFDADINYLKNDLGGGTFGATLDLAQGLDIFGATPDGSLDLSRKGATTSFTKLAGAARYTRPIVDNFSFALAVQGQFAFDRMITGEQIAFGGAQIGRGYDPGAITGDHGLGGSAELRYTTRISDSFVQTIQPFVFFDAAGTWYLDKTVGGLPDQVIESTGVGIRGWFSENITVGVEVDRTLRAVPGSDAGRKATKVLVDLAIRF